MPTPTSPLPNASGPATGEALDDVRRVIDLLVPAPRARRRAVLTAAAVSGLLALVVAGAVGGAFAPRLAVATLTEATAVVAPDATGTITVRVPVRNDGFLPVEVRSLARAWPGYELVSAEVVVGDTVRPFPVRLAGREHVAVELQVRVTDCAQVRRDNPTADDESLWFDARPLLAPAGRQRVQVGRHALGAVIVAGLCPA